MGHWGTCPPSSIFASSVHSAAAASLTVKISKITKKQVLHFRLSRQKHVKTHVNRLKQSRNPKKIPEGRRGKIHVVSPHLISWRRHCIYVSSSYQEHFPRVQSSIS